MLNRKLKNFPYSPWGTSEVTNYKANNNFHLEPFWQEENEKWGEHVSEETYSNSFL